eukprot:232945_1
MGITFSEPATCGCERAESKDNNSRNRNPNTTPPHPKTHSTSNEFSLIDKPSHGLSAETMDTKTKELLLKFDDSFSPTTSKTIHFVPIINEIDNNKSDIIIDIINDKQTSQPQIRRISTDEKDISPTNNRLLEIQNISNIDELADTIRSHYDTPHSDHSHSSIDEAEKAEIERLKSDHKIKEIKITKSNVYRQGTTNPWDEDDIDDLHDEYTEHMLDLTKQASDVEIKHLNYSNQLHKQNNINENVAGNTPSTGLYRDGSNEKK